MKMAEVNREDVSFSSRVIRTVFVVLLLDLLAFTLILPLLPSILEHHAQTGVRTHMHIQTFTLQYEVSILAGFWWVKTLEHNLNIYVYVNSM